MLESVIQLARRAEADPHFLAFAFAEYARREGLDEAGLLARLGVALDTLTAARLCRTPRTNTTTFQEDTDRIADKFGLDRDVLLQIVRHAEVIVNLRRGNDAVSDTVGSFLAARDRSE